LHDRAVKIRRLEQKCLNELGRSGSYGGDGDTYNVNDDSVVDDDDDDSIVMS